MEKFETKITSLFWDDILGESFARFYEFAELIGSVMKKTGFQPSLVTNGQVFFKGCWNPLPLF